MFQNNRKSVRFEDFGRVECPEICPVAGFLDDISLNGCKIHFDMPVSLNMEDDYELKIRLSRFSTEIFTFFAHPQWERQNDGGSSEIGFLLLHSPDTSKLETYINELKKESETSDLPLDLGE